MGGRRGHLARRKRPPPSPVREDAGSNFSGVDGCGPRGRLSSYRRLERRAPRRVFPNPVHDREWAALLGRDCLFEARAKSPQPPCQADDVRHPADPERNYGGRSRVRPRELQGGRLRGPRGHPLLRHLQQPAAIDAVGNRSIGTSARHGHRDCHRSSRRQQPPGSSRKLDQLCAQGLRSFSRDYAGRPHGGWHDTRIHLRHGSRNCRTRRALCISQDTIGQRRA